MALKVPKITYNPGGGPVNLIPTYPPTQKQPTDQLVAERHDIDASEGQRQSVTERVDAFRTLNFDWVPEAQIAAWKSFMDYAVTGAPFDYYPDSTTGTFETWNLEDKVWDPQFAARGGWYKFKIKMRKQVL